MSADPTILRRAEAGNVAVVTINRPAVRNALDLATMRRLGEEMNAAARDESVRAVVLTGAGDVAFSAGGDIGEMTRFTPLALDQAMVAWQDTLGLIERLPKPVVAAVNGYAYGGGTEIAMACHIRVASEDARFGQTEIALDHLPGAGGTQRLPRLIPLSAAYEYLLTGDPIPAADALRLGLVSRIWPKRDLLANALALARRIAARSPVTVRYTLEAVREGLNAPLDTGLRLERAFAALVFESTEARTGLDRFLARRDARRRE